MFSVSYGAAQTLPGCHIVDVMCLPCITFLKFPKLNLKLIRPKGFWLRDCEPVSLFNSHERNFWRVLSSFFFYFFFPGRITLAHLLLSYLHSLSITTSKKNPLTLSTSIHPKNSQVKNCWKILTLSLAIGHNQIADFGSSNLLILQQRNSGVFSF